MRAKYISLSLFFLLIGIISNLEASNLENSILPFNPDIYADQNIVGIWNIIKYRITLEPFNLIATIIFLLSIIHTFLASKISNLAKYYDKNKKKVSYKAEVLHILGEVEIIFAIWLLPLMIAITYFFGWKQVSLYLNRVDYTEAIFVIVIMAIAATKPIIDLAKVSLKQIARLGKCTPAAWWFSILTIGPLLGSFITEPAAMTISAMLLAQQFYDLKPSSKIAYATLGLLFVNVSVGGTLTHFAAPPILMVAKVWNWNMEFMLINFGWKVIIAILISNILYFSFFRKDFAQMKKKAAQSAMKTQSLKNVELSQQAVPLPITILHIGFLTWTVLNLHSIPLVVGGFMFLLACMQVTMHHQYQFGIRAPLLVGLFLAGLVTHGTLQQWWIEPILGQLTEIPLFIGATILTAFNDNAAITFLASLVPEFANNVVLEKAVVYGAVAGGGLTVIANAPNPAGQSILSKFFPEGVSPKNLFLAALIPTIIVSLIFMLFP